jgi:mono/diheme cytochrome c family protein
MAGAAFPKHLVLSMTRFCLLVSLTGCGAHRRQTRLPDAEPGRLQFQSYCAACHQYDGQGMGDAPALAGSPWVTGPESRLIRIVLHGVRGPMVVDGKTYDREMPGFGQILPDAEVASLLSYLRSRFGAPSAPITAEMVMRVRAANQTRTEYWRVDELLEKP